MNRLNKLLSLLLCLTLLLGLCAPAAEAAEDNTVIHLRTADDLFMLAQQCTLDSWSQNMTVLLEGNINLSGSGFTSIPTFGGTFDGQGYTISGLMLHADGDTRGLFRYIQTSGVVKDLTVEGTVLPVDTQNCLGGIAGSNRGTILRCIFRGEMQGQSSIGGIAGINEASGQIVSCSFSGTILGSHYVGGIAGQNYGSIVQCKNSGQINTIELSTSVELDDISLDQLNSTSNVPASTDIGGIAGFSSGIIQSCTNTGEIGYLHVGYNVGGIVGRQTGYLDSCTNDGLVHGRKDVGGIAGQMEPQLVLKYDQSALDRLWGELDTLEAMIDAFLEDTSGAANQLTDRIQGVSDSAAAVKDAVSGLSSAFAGWADGNIEQINDASARISWTLERMVPVMDTVTQAIGQMELAADQISDGLAEASLSAEYGAQTAAELSLASADLYNATQSMQTALAKLQTALGQMEQAMGDSAVVEQTINSMADAISTLASAISRITISLKEIQTALDDLYQWAQSSPALNQLENGIKELGLAAEEITAALDTILAILQSSDPLDPALSEALQLLGPGLDRANQAIGSINAALQSLEGEVPTQEAARIRAAAEAVSNDLVLAGSAAQQFSSALNTLVENADLQALKAALASIKECLSLLELSSYNLTLSLGHMETAMGLLEDTALELSSALDTFSQAGSAVTDSLGLLEQAMADAETIINELAQMPAIRFETLESTVTDEGEVLSTAADGFLDSFNALNEALRAESGLLADDLQAINGQIGVIVDLLHQFQQEYEEKEGENLLEDVSGQDSDDSRSSGKIANCQNLGAVNGDLNVAGIVGSMAVEYDFDPEDDLTVSGGRNFDFVYLARAVVRGCVNRGGVTAKKNYAGGIVGRMDLGRIAACQGYGSVSSTGGSYVGGIAGQSGGGIVGCWAMCTLSGSDYIGGIAGLGSMIQGCRTLIELDGSAPSAGAIAGQVGEDAELSDNYFVHRSLAGVDGISYAGLAEPMSYESFCALESIPADFSRFELVFTADGKTVATLSFRYGDSLAQLPDIPAKAGYSARWPDMDYSFLSFSQTLEAQYIPYETTLSDGQTPPGLLVSGSFSPEAQLTLTEAPAEWSDTEGNHYQGTACTVTVTDSAVQSISYTLHWRLPEKGSYDLWIFNGTDWERQAYTPDGSYLLLECSGESITFCLVETVPSPVIIFILAAAAMLLIIIIIVAAVRIRKKRKKPVVTTEPTA